ncbi:MAG: histidine phosphatase family protein [Hydrogenophilales bacterium 28-61-23]|nr:MAG: histidine phosphatase family protein [Hydrogenophilales bacterium 28-61-23]
MKTTTTFDFLRHGEPVGGKKYRGQIDDPLSEKGWAQMRAATSAERPWSAIVSSPLSRCLAFAHELSASVALPVHVDARLAEVGFGVWEGKTAEQIKRQDPDCIFNFKRDPVGNRPEGAEPLADFFGRVVAAYEDLHERYAGQHVLVVAHAGVIRMAICHALGLPPGRAYGINVGSAGLARIRLEIQSGQRLDSLMFLSKGG